MVVTGGEEEVELAQGAPALRRAVNDQLADRLGTLGAARLASDHELDAACLKTLAEAAHLRALAGPLSAFQRDEPAPRHPPRLQEAWLPKIR